jgi:hypothetical protein
VEFTRCPYDGSPIEAEAYVGDATLLHCLRCAAAWECHETWLRRVREPDRDAIRAAWASREPVSDGRDAASAEATWRQVRFSITSIPHGSDTTPAT